MSDISRTAETLRVTRLDPSARQACETAAADELLEALQHAWLAHVPTGQVTVDLVAFADLLSAERAVAARAKPAEEEGERDA